MDLRTPIGLLFSIFGVLLLGFGATHTGAEFERVGVNVNLTWGGVLLGFGLFMLLLAALARRKAASDKHEVAGGGR
ncbi:MAG: hypothetical protein ACYC6M_12685 [Terriglobales bacterium]